MVSFEVLAGIVPKDIIVSMVSLWNAVVTWLPDFRLKSMQDMQIPFIRLL